MKILVTGGAGFIGSNLTEFLLSQGHSVRVLDDFSAGKRKNLEGLAGDLEVLEGSITDSAICTKACEGVDAISHQAAHGSVPRSLEFPELYSDVNLHGFVVLANAARKAGIKRFVYASSSSVYGDLEESPKVESRVGTLLSPYAASKAANEMFAQSFATAYDMTFVGLRYFNVYGPKQDPNGAYAAVIPLFLRHLLKGESATIFGDGEQSRDFTYVGNVIQANFNAMTLPDLSGAHALNIACGDSTTVNDLYTNIAKNLDSKIAPTYHEPRKGDILHSLADISLARKTINLNPEVELEEGLKKTVTWFLKNKDTLFDDS